MSNTIIIMGKSGSGKSTSIRNLNPAETFIINALGKPLPFPGAKNKYVKISQDGSTGNYYANDNTNKIRGLITHVDMYRPDIKTLILDDFTYTITNEFMRSALEKGYEKFSKLAQNAWNILRDLNYTREDLLCIVLMHSDETTDGSTKIKTVGKMLDDQVLIEGMVTTVLHALIIDGEYKFLTNGESKSLAKSPMGLFDKIIPNDLQYVVDKVNGFQA